MGLAGLSFAAGLGAGYVDQSRYQERQDQLNREQARQDAEFQMRKELADEALAERKQARADMQTIKDAAKDAQVAQYTTLDTGDGAKVYDMPKGVDSQDVAASDARQFRRNTEKTTGAEAPMPVVSSTTTVNGKAYDSAAAGLKAAAEYNDPAAKNLRIASALESIGRPDAAMDYRSKAEKFKQDMYDAQRAALFRRGSELIARGDLPGLLDAYNKHYGDGKTATISTDGKAILQKDKDGVTVGELPIGANKDDMLLAFRDLVYPDKRTEERQAIRAADEKDAATTRILPKEAALVKNGVIGAVNDVGLERRINPDGTVSLVRPGSGKVDHYADKEWDDLHKWARGEYKIDDPSGLRPASSSPVMAAARSKLVDAIHQAGAIAPNRAAAISLQLENNLIKLAREAMAKNPKLSFDDAASAVYYSRSWQARAKEGIEYAMPKVDQQPAQPGQPAQRPTSTASAAPGGSAASASGQKAADAEARQVLETEVKKQATRLAVLQEEFNNGKPTPRADEANNPQKYASRVEELKAAIARTEKDIDGINKELRRSGAAPAQASAVASSVQQTAQPTPAAAQAPSAPAKQPVALAPIVPANPAPGSSAPSQSSYMAPPNSPAGLTRAKMDKANAEADARRAAEAQRSAAAGAALSGQAVAALEISDPAQRARAAFRIQSSPDFGSMDPAMRKRIYDAVNGVRS